MSRRGKNIVVLGVEAILVVAMCASLAYFLHDSRDFIARRPGAAPGFGTATK